MLKQLFKYKWFISIILILIVIEPSINSVMNFLLQKLFNSATVGADRIMIIRLLTAGFLLWMVKRVVIFVGGVLRSRFICNAKHDVKHQMFVNIMRLSTSNIANIASSGEYISIFTNDITLLETRFYSQIIGLISGVFSIAIMGSAFLALNVKLGGAILSLGILAMFVPKVFSQALNSRSLAYSKAISSFTQKIKEFIVAFPTIKNYAIEDEITQRFNMYNIGAENAKYDSDVALNLANCVGQLMSWFMQLLGVGLGLMLVVKGEIKIGTVIAAQSFAADLADPLQNIIFNINSIRSVKEIVNRLERMSKPILQETVEKPIQLSEIKANEDEVKIDGCEITFDDLSLQIENKMIIDHFSFTFEAGKKYLMVGLNGSGKSSLFRTLKKWYGNCKGDIRINGMSVAYINSEQLSGMVSYLNESVSLFSGTVQDNIELFKTYNEQQLRKAIDDAKIELDLSRSISDEGKDISSGEQRRIEIARSLLKSAKVLVFDEVVSTLDVETAYEIEKMALDFDPKTVIFISHNFSGKLIREYDEILVMDNGKLIGHGKFDELRKTCGYFNRICDIKFGNDIHSES